MADSMNGVPTWFKYILYKDCTSWLISDNRRLLFFIVYFHVNCLILFFRMGVQPACCVYSWPCCHKHDRSTSQHTTIHCGHCINYFQEHNRAEHITCNRGDIRNIITCGCGQSYDEWQQQGCNYGFCCQQSCYHDNEHSEWTRCQQSWSWLCIWRSYTIQRECEQDEWCCDATDSDGDSQWKCECEQQCKRLVKVIGDTNWSCDLCNCCGEWNRWEFQFTDRFGKYCQWSDRITHIHLFKGKWSGQHSQSSSRSSSTRYVTWQFCRINVHLYPSPCQICFRQFSNTQKAGNVYILWTPLTSFFLLFWHRCKLNCKLLCVNDGQISQQNISQNLYWYLGWPVLMLLTWYALFLLVYVTVRTGWDSWSSWSICTERCSGGVQLRSRVCRHQSLGCHGNRTELRSCARENCSANNGKIM